MSYYLPRTWRDMTDAEIHAEYAAAYAQADRMGWPTMPPSTSDLLKAGCVLDQAPIFTPEFHPLPKGRTMSTSNFDLLKAELAALDRQTQRPKPRRPKPAKRRQLRKALTMRERLAKADVTIDRLEQRCKRIKRSLRTLASPPTPQEVLAKADQAFGRGEISPRELMLLEHRANTIERLGWDRPTMQKSQSTLYGLTPTQILAEADAAFKAGRIGPRELMACEAIANKLGAGVVIA